MKWMIKGLVAAAILAPTTALAQEAPAEGNWNGVYGTAFVGALLQQSEYFEDYYKNTFNNDGWGGLAGVGVGVNFQQGQSVFGIEADIAALTTDSGFSVNTGDYSSDEAWGAESSADAIATIRARLGMDINNTLYYVTGGYAVALFDHAGVWPDDPSYDSETSGWLGGIVGGAGFESSIGGGMNLRVEGLYADFDNTTAEDSNGYEYGFDNSMGLVRIVLVKKF
jgi:outer membrane immunogenic protein